MERTRRGSDQATAGRSRPAGSPAGRPKSLTDEILVLQAAAGNRSVAAAIGDATAQRDSKPGTAPRNDGGVLTFDSGEVIPLQTVTWSATQRFTQDVRGDARMPTTTIPVRLEFGDLEITRLRDAHSPRVDEILDAKQHDHATLTLNQPSADGGLPAEKFELQNVGVKEIREAKGDDLTEHVTVYVGHMAIAGQLKDDSKATQARAVAHFKLAGGRSTPVLAWEQSPARGRKPSVREEGALGSQNRIPDQLVTITIRIPAGEVLNSLAALLDGGRHFDGTLTPIDGKSEVDLEQMLVEDIRSSSLGPGVVEVKLVAETSRLRQAP